MTPQENGMRRKCEGGSFLKQLESPVRSGKPWRTTDYTKRAAEREPLEATIPESH